MLHGKLEEKKKRTAMQKVKSHIFIEYFSDSRNHGKSNF